MGASCSNARADDLSPPQDVLTGIPARFCQRNLMVTVLAGLAEFERELIVARTSEGRTRAKARGVKLGPRFKLSAEQRAYVAGERAKGESVRHLARILGVSKATIGRIPAAEP